MAARRLFLNQLNAVLESIYRDTVHECKKVDPDFDADDTDNIDVNILTSKCGKHMIVCELFNDDCEFVIENLQWKNKVDKADSEFLEFLNKHFEHKIPGYFCFGTDWTEFSNTMLDSCMYFNAGKFGCIDLSACEQLVQTRFEQLCMCSLIARHGHSNRIDPLLGPNMARFI